MSAHKVKVRQNAHGYLATCAGCDWRTSRTTYSDAAVRGVTHQVAHQGDHEIRRRVDWTEPMEDT